MVGLREEVVMSEEKKKGWIRGALDKIEAQADVMKESAEAQKKKQAANAAEAGSLVIQKTFGTRTIAIYDRGYVRVSTVHGLSGGFLPTTPYEKLLSIQYGERVQDRGSFKNAAYRLPGASKQQRSLDLTIATDRTVHTFTTEKEALSRDDKAGRALEAAGQAVLDSLGSSAAAPTASQPDPADQLKKLADLHAAGILTDEEFAAKKAELLGRM